jgi:hypothetical protein
MILITCVSNVKVKFVYPRTRARFEAFFMHMNKFIHLVLIVKFEFISTFILLILIPVISCVFSQQSFRQNDNNLRCRRVMRLLRSAEFRIFVFLAKPNEFNFHL